MTWGLIISGTQRYHISPLLFGGSEKIWYRHVPLEQRGPSFEAHLSNGNAFVWT